MNVLVTGATGFLGTRLCQVLEESGHEVVRLSSKNCDLTKSSSLDQFSKTTYDRIFHLAAWTQAGDFCLYHPGEQWIVNEQMNAHVLGWWQRAQPQAKLVCIGTSCSYAPDMPLLEENYLIGTPISSLFTYAMTKRMLYVGLVALHKQFDLSYLCVVPSTLYGPGYHAPGRQMHFIFDLIRKILRGKLYGEPVVLWGDGNQSRELIYIDSFVAAMLALTEKYNAELVNIGAGKEFTINHFARLISDYVGYDYSRIQYDDSRYVGARSKCLDTSKLLRLLPDFINVDLDHGLTKTIDWFSRQPDLVSRTQ